MSDPTDGEPRCAPARGIVCPRCRSTGWRVWMTRPAPNRLVRVKTCQTCFLRVRTREVIEAVVTRPQSPPDARAA